MNVIIVMLPSPVCTERNTVLTLATIKSIMKIVYCHCVMKLGSSLPENESYDLHHMISSNLIVLPYPHFQKKYEMGWIKLATPNSKSSIGK